LVALPDAGSKVGAWGGDCAATFGDKCLLQMSTAKSVSVTFTSPPPPLSTLSVTVASVAGATGRVSGVSQPAQTNIDCGATCSAQYTSDTSVTLVARPDPGSAVGEWGGDCVGANGPTCVLEMGASRNVTVAFTRPNTVFVTSTEYSLEQLRALGTGSGAAAVLTGADRACADAATASGSLAPPGQYVAWISSREASGVQRLVAANGGSMPRGWLRVDGRPFMDQLLERHVLYPVMLDEKGQRTNAVWYFTGTGADGTHQSTFDCDDWTTSSSSSLGMVGLPGGGGDYWTTGIAGWCGSVLPVLCLQANYLAQVPRPAPPANGKLVFTAQFFMPGSGLEGADAVCASDAASAGLSGTFRALLATSTASAASRFHPTGLRPYVRTDGVVVSAVDGDLFNNWSSMLAPLGVSAIGNTIGSTAFTGAPTPTSLGDFTCGDWTNGTSTANSQYGSAGFTGLGYFSGFVDDCTRGNALYCIED
jgi:hypothetical protein